MYLQRIILGMLVALFVVGVGAVEGQPLPPKQPIGFPKLSDDVHAVSQGNNVFALNLYAQLSKEKGNLFFSPNSISTALAMTYAGAKGKTAEDMASTLHFGLPSDRLHAALGDLVKHLNGQGANRPYQLSVANRLWGQKNYNFLPAFLKLTENSYGAGLQEVDFVGNAEQARQIINAWVEKETKEKIKELIQKNILNADTRLVLTNAIYFKAGWAIPFPDKGTMPEDFTLADGKQVKAPTMTKSEIMSYHQAGNFAAVRIPYKGNALSMIILLPKDANGLGDVEKSLTSAELAKFLQQMKPHRVDLKLPKFKTTSEFSLKKVLSDMGMAIAFSPAADFSGMTTQDSLFISAVIHKAFVDVHEKGTEAAAATAVIMAKSEAPIVPEATFHVNRPFTFLIQENHSGSILFMGRVMNPNG